MTKEGFQGEWTAPGPEFTAVQPESQTGLAGPLLSLFRSSLLKTGVLSLPLNTGLQPSLLKPLN